MIATNMAEAAVSMAEAQAYARVETGEEEALLAALVRTTSALCETFTGQVLVARPFEEVLPAGSQWQRLALSPVRSIEEVARLALDGTAETAPTGEYEVDIDSRGDGWVRVTTGGDRKLRIRGQAGLAVDPNGEAGRPVADAAGCRSVAPRHHDGSRLCSCRCTAQAGG